MIFSLLREKYSAEETEESPRKPEFVMGKEINERIYDMTIILEALRNWRDIKLPDPLATKALKYLVKAYDLNP